MDCVYYKLTKHQQYIRLLEVLHPLTKYIELVPVCPPDDIIVPWSLQNLELVEQGFASEWHGTAIDGKPLTRYLFRWNEISFRHFLELHNFYIFVESPIVGEPTVVLETEFGWSNVTFLDAARNPLFYTITHEGEAFIRESLLEMV